MFTTKFPFSDIIIKFVYIYRKSFLILNLPKFCVYLQEILIYMTSIYSKTDKSNLTYSIV